MSNNLIFNFSLNDKQITELDAAIVQRILHLLTEEKSDIKGLAIQNLYDIRDMYTK
jgi:hypothetical protein